MLSSQFVDLLQYETWNTSYILEHLFNYSHLVSLFTAGFFAIFTWTARESTAKQWRTHETEIALSMGMLAAIANDIPAFYIWLTEVAFFYITLTAPNGLFSATARTWHGAFFALMAINGIDEGYSRLITLFQIISIAESLWKMAYCSSFPIVLHGDTGSTFAFTAICGSWIGVRILGFGVWILRHAPTMYARLAFGSVWLMQCILLMHLLYWARDSMTPEAATAAASPQEASPPPLMYSSEEDNEEESSSGGGGEGNLIVCPVCKKSGYWTDVQCKLCESIWYCSSVCRTRGWRTHQKHCAGKIKSSL